MNISRRSWHFWLYNKFSKTDPEAGSNLCQYVQTILLGIFVTILVLVLVGITVFGLGVLICGVTMLAAHYLHWYALLVPVVVVLMGWLTNRRRFQHNDTYILVSEYIQAKKNRFCPTVKFTE